MSSTASGDQLEFEIFELFQCEIQSGRFFLQPDCCKIYWKKGYYSKDREKNIIFDIAIEVFLPGSKSFSLLILIECKNYKKSVPVDDAEEFFAKVQQISGANIKGIIASSNSFQESTLKYCKSKGIGLLRYFRKQDFKWILERSSSSYFYGRENKYNSITEYIGITSDSFKSQYFDCYFAIGDLYANSLRSFFLEFVNSFIIENNEHKLRKLIYQNPSEKYQANLVEYISPEDIESIALKALEEINYLEGEVSLIHICKLLSVNAGLILKEVNPSKEEESKGILGRIKFNPLEIVLINQKDHNMLRQRFTLAHELGHYFLNHSRYISQEYCQEEDFSFSSGEKLRLKDLQIMERQANEFASYLLLPKNTFVKDFLELAKKLNLRDRGYSLLFVDDQRCNQENYFLIMNKLQEKYKVSISAMKIRLEKLGLLKDGRSRVAHISRILS